MIQYHHPNATPLKEINHAVTTKTYTKMLSLSTFNYDLCRIALGDYFFILIGTTFSKQKTLTQTLATFTR